MNMKQCAPVICLSLVLAVVTGAVTLGQPSLSVAFRATVHDQPVSFDDSLYALASGARYSVSMVKFYVSNIRVVTAVSADVLTVFAPSGHHLVDLSDDESATFSLPIPAADVRSIDFTIGVDSILNEQGPREGALDPRNGMYWTWATGYIFFKLEGTIESSSQPKRAYELHIGGYKAPFRNMIDVHCTIPVRSRSTRDVIIDMDLARLLEGPHSIDLAKRPSVTTAQQAVDVAPRIGEMFRVR